MARWLELSVTVPEVVADVTANRLIELGAPGTIEEEAPDGGRRIRAHFAEATDTAELLATLRGWLESVGEVFGAVNGIRDAPIDADTVEDEDWAEGWKSGFPPLDVGTSLRIRTPWSEPSGERLEVEILPAMAFGTGRHASTLGCLLALEAIVARRGALSPVLDAGTGSGILAIAAARLGCDRIVAVDTDPVAVDAARENVRRNGVERAVELSTGSIRDAGAGFVLVLANLYAGLLASLFDDFRAVAAADALLVTSGFLDVDRESVSAAAAHAGWHESSARSLDGWTTLVFERGRAGR